ncbi:MAG: competence/damage-inducible protein A, partial [Syntrophaceae bacterium]|nr:competence/damage-inducible protein A [Syntrophaceae bacterium]
MKAEIIAIGSELLLGQLVDTNSSYIAKRLAENGIELIRTTTVGDHLKQMKEVINEAINRSHIVITTGGIGPTEDDLTREAIAEVFQRPLRFQPHLMEQIEQLFKKRGFRMAENNRKQA